MSQTIHPKEAEKQVFRLATLDDGIWEIYLGLFFILMSFYSLTRSLIGPIWNLVLVLSLLLLLVSLVWLAKKYLALPRTGMVKFGSRTRKKIKTANLVTWGLVFTTIVLWILGSKKLLNEPTWARLPQWVSDFDVDLVFALVIVAIFAIIAYAMSLPRFYLHGLLLGIGNFSSTVLLVYNNVKFGWPVAAAGGIITIIGVFVLFRFLRSYPLPKMEVSNAR
jgi:hypothetical protein